MIDRDKRPLPEETARWHYYAADARCAQSAKASFVGFLLDSYFAECDSEDAQLIFSELMANVIRHAPGPVGITATAHPCGRVKLDVCDSGVAFSLAVALPIDPLSMSGRGLFIVSQLSETLDLARTIDGNIVSVVIKVID